MNIVIFGLGPIGKDLLKKAIQMSGVHVVGVVDIHPDYIGKEAAQLVDMEPIDIYVVEHISEVEESANTIVLHAAGSTLATSKKQFETLLYHGYSVISTCEELLYPWKHHVETANDLDQLAKKQKVFLLGTGINPGFLMDSLPLFLTAITSDIKHIAITRVVNAGLRRLPLQQKVGIGLTASQFEERKKQKSIGHVGLEESLQLLAAGIGHPAENMEHELEPVFSFEEPAESIEGVTGIHETIFTLDQEGRSITLDLTMALNQISRDEIVIETIEEHDLRLIFPEGVFGDSTTTNIVLNTAKTLADTNTHGLLTMADIPLVRNTDVSFNNASSLKKNM